MVEPVWQVTLPRYNLYLRAMPMHLTQVTPACSVPDMSFVARSKGGIDYPTTFCLYTADLTSGDCRKPKPQDIGALESSA